MGYALARAARDRGAEVNLVSAPTALGTPRGVNLLPVESAQQMHDAVMDRLADCDALIMAAAVADYRADEVSSQKIKKGTGKLALNLGRTPDILGAVAEKREQTRQPAVVVGFAAETEHLLINAEGKLKRKGLDLIVANDISAEDSGFGVDTNRVVLLDAGGSTELPLLSKENVAHEILNRVREILHSKDAVSGADRSA